MKGLSWRIQAFSDPGREKRWQRIEKERDPGS